MNKVITIVLSVVLVAVASLNAVYADDYRGSEDSEGRVNIPGSSISLTPTPQPEENIAQANGEVKDGVLTVALNFSEATKFAIKTEEVCGAVNNIIVETNKGFTGLIKVSKADETKTNNVENKIGDCSFELEGFDNSFVENINWTLKIARKDLENMDISLKNVKLLISEEEKLEPVDTKTTDESNSEYVIYEATTDDFSDGVVAVAESKNNLFSAQNIAYLVFSVLGLLVLVAIGYLLLKKED